MNRATYNQLIADAKAEALFALGPSPSPQRVQHVLDTLAQRVAAATRDFHLTNLMGIEELATHLGTTDSAVRRLLIRRNAESPLGLKTGRAWIVDIDELPALERDRRRRTRA